MTPYDDEPFPGDSRLDRPRKPRGPHRRDGDTPAPPPLHPAAALTCGLFVLAASAVVAGVFAGVAWFAASRTYSWLAAWFPTQG